MRAALAVRVAQSDKEFEWAKHDVARISRVIIKSSGDYYTATQRVLTEPLIGDSKYIVVTGVAL